MRSGPRIAAVTAIAAAGLAAPAAAAACPYESETPNQLTVREGRTAIRCLANAVRERHGRVRLNRNRKLQRAAQKHSRDMDLRNFFSHTAPGGVSFVDRIRDTGYLSGTSAWGIGENLAWGSGELGTPKEAMRSWLNSPAHRRTLLNRDYRQIGVGVALGSPTGSREQQSAIYTTDFGYR